MTILLFALTVLALAISTSAVSGWTDTQNKVHEIADMARELGLPEDDPIIKRASEIWWEEDARVKAEAAKPKLTALGTMYITGYDPYCAHCCGKSDGITASGVKAVIGETVAMKGYAFGTKIYIEGLGYYTVHDRGVGSNWVDVACTNHAECYAITGYYQVYLVEG